MTGKNDDAARAREDSFLAELIPQVTEHLAERRAEDFDAGAGQARFETWLAAHTKEPAAPAKGRAGTGYARPAATGWIKRFLIWLSDAQDAVSSPGLRSRKSNTGKNASRKWQDNRPAWGTDDSASRYMQIPEIDRWRAVPFDMPPAPERDDVLRRVRQLTESLEGAIDEGTGAALDRLIESWVAAWIATVEGDYVDHGVVITVHRGQAAQWLTESTLTARHENEELEHIGAAYNACRSRLADEQAERAIGGHSRTGFAFGVLLVLAGALTVTVAFRNTLALALPSLSGILAWLTAAGATSWALVAAASVGISLAIRRKVGRSGSRLATVLITAAWIGLGLATVLIPLLGTSAHFTPLAALFSGAIYLISGACTVFQSEKLYNPEYFAFRRLAKQYSKQVQKAAEAQANVNRARSAVDQLDSELDREDHRRLAAIAGRKALGTEAANYARLLMAAMLRDPAKTGLTETGPVPEPMPAVPEFRVIRGG